MALELNEEMQEQLKEICDALIKESADEASAKEKKRIRIKTIYDKKDLVLKAFLKNYVELGNIINKASVEDVNEVLAAFNTASVDEEKIKELETKRTELREEINKISIKIASLRLSAKNGKKISVK